MTRVDREPQADGVAVHRHRIQLRWSDLDSLNHVNNVRFLDYALEARQALADAGRLDPARICGTTTIDFVRPLLLAAHTVVVNSTISDGRIDQEIVTEGAGAPLVHARMTSTFGETPDELVPVLDGPGSYPFWVRYGDSVPGSFGSALLFELFQEARISLMAPLRQLGGGSFVIAKAEVTPIRAIRWQADPYAVRTEVRRVGRSSMELGSEASFGGDVYARALVVMVAFDPAEQRPRPFNEHERDYLGQLTRR